MAHDGVRVRLVGGPRIIATVSEMFSIPKPPEWQDAAVCAQTDPDIFHPEIGCSTRPAKTLCHTCDVETECLEYALERGERFGVWGGRSERERRKMVQDRRAAERFIHCRICDSPFDGGPRDLDCSEPCRAESRRRRSAKKRRAS